MTAYRSALVVSMGWILVLHAAADEPAPAFTRAKLGDSLQLALSLEQRAVTAASSGDAGEAQALAARALAIRETLLGPNAPGVAPALQALGVACVAAGEREEGEFLLQRALEIRSKALGPRHPALAADLFYLGEVELQAARADAAAGHLEAALELIGMSGAPRAHDRALVQSTLAVARVAQQRVDDAERLEDEASAAWVESGEPRPPVALVLACDHLGYEAWHRGQASRAEQYYRRAARLAESAFGAADPGYAATLLNLGSLLEMRGHGDAAETLYRHALRILEQRAVPDYPRLALALDRLRTLYASSGRAAESARLRTRLLTLRAPAARSGGPER
jgi:hypothetical protein